MAYVYSGVWRGGSDGYYLWANASWENFNAKWQALNGQGLRLADLEVYEGGGQRLWSGVWRAGNDAHYLWVNADWPTSTQSGSSSRTRASGSRAFAPTAAIPPSMPAYGARGTDGHYLWVNAPWSNFNAKWQELSAANLRLVNLDTYVVNGQRLWAGCWRSGSDGHYLWVDANWDAFRAKWQQLSGQGLRLTVLRTYGTNPVLYAGVWRAGSDPYYLWVNASWDNFAAKWQELAAQNLRLINMTARWIGPKPTVRLHAKILTAPTIPFNTMLTQMRDLYESVGINVTLASTENLEPSDLERLRCRRLHDGQRDGRADPALCQSKQCRRQRRLRLFRAIHRAAL